MPRKDRVREQIAEFAEEWLTSAQAMGHASRPASARVLPWEATSPQPVRANGKPCPGVSPTRAPSRLPPGEEEQEFAM